MPLNIEEVRKKMIIQRFGANLKESCVIVGDWIKKHGLMDAYRTYEKEHPMTPLPILLNDFYILHKTEDNEIKYC